VNKLLFVFVIAVFSCLLINKVNGEGAANSLPSNNSNNSNCTDCSNSSSSGSKTSGFPIVIIELDPADVNPVEINMSDFIDQLLNISVINESDLTLGVETSDNGTIITVVVYVEDDNVTVIPAVIEILNSTHEDLSCDRVICRTSVVHINQCYLSVFGEETMQANASEWGELSSECFNYHCDNDTGRAVTHLCSINDGSYEICVDGHCVENTLDVDDAYSVVIELEGLPLKELNSTDVIQNICRVTGLTKLNFSLGVEVNSKGLVVRMYVTNLKDKELARQVLEKIQNDNSDSIIRSRRMRITGAGIIGLSSHVMVDLIVNLFCFVLVLLFAHF